MSAAPPELQCTGCGRVDGWKTECAYHMSDCDCEACQLVCWGSGRDACRAWSKWRAEARTREAVRKVRDSVSDESREDPWYVQSHDPDGVARWRCLQCGAEEGLNHHEGCMCAPKEDL